MNAQPETAAHSETGSTSKTSEKPEDPSSPSTIAGVPAGPSLMERILGLFRHRNGTSLREEIADALAEPAMGGESFSPGERAMLNNILRLREVRVEDVMVPRVDIEAVEIGTTLGELMSLFEKSGHRSEERRVGREGTSVRTA